LLVMHDRDGAKLSKREETGARVVPVEGLIPRNQPCRRAERWVVTQGLVMRCWRSKRGDNCRRVELPPREPTTGARTKTGELVTPSLDGDAELETSLRVDID